MSWRAVLCVVAAGACTPSPSPDAGSNGNNVASAVDAGDRTSPSASVTSSASASTPPAPPSEPEPTYDEIAAVLAIDGSACSSSLPSEARIRCLYDQRYRGDAKAAGFAYELWVKWKIVAGVERAYTMDGGYRGMIKIEPATPLNADRQHLEWIVGALRDFEQFFDDLARYGRDAGVAATSKLYRWRPITLRFFRSVAARTPSAYADSWTVAYNLVGSLNKSADSVRETFFHELFHLNDYARPSAGDKPWSDGALRPSFDPIWKKCNTSIPCLTPYTPTDTVVRGGTFYAFQPGNGPAGVEYAAELATRYYREQRAIFRGLPRVKPFKCGPSENGRAWSAMRDEYFGGIDAVPACP